MSFARLTALLFLIGLTASRVGLVLHEVVGHFGVAHATSDAGCVLSELRLFWFGGGWVDFDCGARTLAQHLASDLGGIAVEVALGTALLALGARRRHGLLGLFAVSLGLLFVLHALFYLVTGVHYGAGDGRALHVLLGDCRAPWVAAGSAALVALSFAFARGLGRRLAPLAASVRAGWRRLALVTAAIALATALHGALMLFEQRLLADATYAAAFQPQPEIEAEASLRRFESQRPRAPAEIATKRRELEAAHAIFPLRPWLGAGIAIASLAGLALARRRAPRDDGDAALGSPRSLGWAAAACAASIALAAALDHGW